MGKILAQHWPHFGFLVIGVAAFLWFAYRPERSDRPVAVEEPTRLAPAPGNVSRSVARRGLLALGPLLGAVATGAVLYGVDVGGDSPPAAVIWMHAGISGLAALLVVYKMADVGVSRIRRGFSRERLTELVSMALMLVSVPLVVSGVALVFAPGTGSFLACSHLISSAWWTGLIGWHLRRYLRASMRAVFNSRRPRAHGGRSALGSARAASVPRSDPRPSRPA